MERGPPASPTSSVSIASDQSRDRPPDLGTQKQRPPASPTSSVSLASDQSRDRPPDLETQKQRPSASTSSSVSIASDQSRDRPPDLEAPTQRPSASTSSSVSLASDQSRDRPPDLEAPNQRPSASTSSSVSIASDQSRDRPPDLGTQKQSSSELQATESTLGLWSEGASNNPARDAANKKDNPKERLVLEVKERILGKFEKELSKFEEDSKLFKISSNDVVKTINFDKAGPTVLTKGVAGIGKTFQTWRLMVDWAKGRSNSNIDFIIPLSLRELKKRGNEKQSLKELLNPFLYGSEWKGKEVSISECKIVIILDGFEEIESLDFKNKVEDINDVKKPATLDVLLTSLVKRTLLPTACLWIISQPSGADKIPPQHISEVTECRETLKRWKRLASNLKKSFAAEYNPKENLNHENQKNTEHILREHHAEETSEKGQTTGKAKKKTLINIGNIFKQNEETVRIVLTVGETNVGKTFFVQKFVEAWAKDNNQQTLFSRTKTFFNSLLSASKDDVGLLFPIQLSKYEFTMETTFSLVGLLNKLFEDTKKSVISDYSKFQVAFILDGLDAFQLPLDFDNEHNKLNDPIQPAPLNVVLTNLIRGDLLPSAQIWITSQSSAAEKLPAHLIDRKTEIREKPDITSKKRLKCQMKKQLTYVSQGTDGDATSALLNEIYTDLYIIEGDRGEVNTQNEGKQILDARTAKEEKPIRYSNIFKNPSEENVSSGPAGRNVPIRTVLTIGVAGIGKTFASMKYMLDWAEAPLGEGLDYIFSLPFRELNLRKGHEHSLEKLVHQFFPAMETSEITDYNQFKILIVLDGFDECRLDLNFDDSLCWRDVKEPTSVDVLVTNLIQGNLLPKAQIWITSRPAASNKIPSKEISRVTEVRGFNDEQKEEYFRKRFKDEELAKIILSEVKRSRSIFIMCYIPVFCWITSKVMEDIVTQNQGAAKPKTLTDMYTYFLLQQCKQANVKYNKNETSEHSEADSCWNERNKETVLSLGKLAFEELEKGNLLFTEDHLKDCGINITNAAVFSGLFTQIKRENSGLYPQELFCFVHLSIQEFLAAFYVTYRFTDEGENVFTEATPDSMSPASDFYKKAVDKALESKNGDWDMFLRFMLGLSLETNQNLLRELLEKPEKEEIYTKTYKDTVDHIKSRIRENDSDPDKNLNLFHCLNELNDTTLAEEVKKSLQSETKSFESYSPSQWSALTYVLLTSDANLDVFDLKMYLKSEKVLLGMLPVVKVSQTTLLDWCNLTAGCCSRLSSSVLSSPSSNLTVLDLSHNDLLDAGVEQLAEGLQSVHCKLKTLKLAGCQVTERGCSALASALKENSASQLKELDLSYNHPGGRGLAELTEIFAGQRMNVDYAGEHRLKPGLKKYDVLLELDKNTAGQRLILSNGNRKVRTLLSVKDREPRPKDEQRFKRSQVLCKEGLEDLGYWEVEWKGEVGIAVAYNNVGRKWDANGGLGVNDNSWSLRCSERGFTRNGKPFKGFIALHGKSQEYIEAPPYQKLAVFLDWKGGTLSYYGVSLGEPSLIHTFTAEFRAPVFPGFWFKRGSVTLCDLESSNDADGQQ